MGALAVIRCSGKGIFTIIDRLFESGSNNPQTGKACLGWIANPATGEKLDQVMVTKFKGPRSYTGEDLVEISGHGGMHTPFAILDLLLKNGCRLAGPGEFTRRALQNGKVNLFQAESVNEIVFARTAKQRQMALFGLDRRSSSPFFAVQKRVEDWLMRAEASIEFPEEDDPGVFDIPRLKSDLDDLRNRMETMLADALRAKRIRNGLLVPIAGPANVGKSSLFNWLCNSERVIVDAQPGTTRDAVEEELEIAGMAVRLVDTAGIRSRPGRIEGKGIRKTHEYLQAADLIIWMHDNSTGEDADQARWQEEFMQTPSIHFRNKSDLPSHPSHGRGLPISLTQQNGLEQALEILRENIDTLSSLPESHVCLSVTQRECLTKANDCAHRLARVMNDGECREEIIAEELKSMLQSLEPLGGMISDEQLLNRIFGEFCIGK